jgi:general secretion pathway protein A
MYEQHFGFSRPLFSNTMPQGDAVFRTEATDILMRDLATALARRDSVCIISGASGTGKTTLALDGIKELSTRLAFACISQPPRSENELLEQLLTDFGYEPAGKSRVEQLQLWRQFLSEMAATDTRICLLVENIECLETAVLASLHQLTAADTSLSPGANVVLTSTEAADSLLMQPDLRAFSQRVRLRRRIIPISERETNEYLVFKCRYGGCDADAVFTDDAAAVLHEFSGGILRLIDSMLESAFITAAAARQARISGDLVSSIAESQFGMSGMHPADVAALLDASAPTKLAPGQATIDMAADDGIPVLTEYVVASLTYADCTPGRALAG